LGGFFIYGYSQYGVLCSFAITTGKEKKLMIKFSIFYPNEEGKKFDMDYYINSHIPMVQEKLGEAVKGGAVDQGLAGAEPGSPATYIAMGHLLFDSVEELQSAFGPHMEAIMADIPNYTDIQPSIQISEVKM
jgi:uncharacterized protein (TIGR02118 family)